MNMRYLWRSLLSVFVLWFALSPVLCYASETEINATTESAISNDGIMLLDVTEDDVANGLVFHQFILTASPTYDIIYSSAQDSFVSPFYKTYTKVETTGYAYDSACAYNKWSELGYEYFTLYSKLGMVDGTVLVDAEKSFELSLYGINHWLAGKFFTTIGASSEYYYPQFFVSPTAFEKIGIEYYGFNGETLTEWLTTECLVIDGDTFGIDAELTAPDFDVKLIQVVFPFLVTDYNFNKTVPDGYTFHYAEEISFKFNFTDGVLKIKVQDENTGLLKSIVQWLKSIRDGILDLPNKIWSAMENGLKGLFVPSEDDMVAYKDKWDELLAERFGVVYQSGTLITDTLSTITEQSAQGTINMPSTTIHFAETDFTFGGYDVAVVPEGFEWLVEVIKGLIDIVITVAFINAMRTKYDQLMRG